MLKYALLAGSMIVATPLLAQTTKPAPTTITAPQPAPVKPAPVDPAATDPAATTPAPVDTAKTTPTPPAADPNAQATNPAPVDPATAAKTPPADPATVSNPTPTDPALANTPTTPAPNATTPAPNATTPAPGAQVADVVSKEFPTYDKNGNGTLSKAEFSTWMLALKKTSDPAAKDDAANKSWTSAAFAQADTDKSSSLSKDELTNFLAQGQSKAS